jgi:hypothetical protein
MNIRVAIPVSKKSKPIGSMHLVFSENDHGWAFTLCGAPLHRFRTFNLEDEIPDPFEQTKTCQRCWERARTIYESMKKDRGIKDK